HLREPRARVAVRQSQLLRDLPDRSGAKYLLQLTAGDRHVGARADPGTHLAPITALLKLADDAGEAAVLLDDLQGGRQQRALPLRGGSAHQAAEHAVEYSHGDLLYSGGGEIVGPSLMPTASLETATTRRAEARASNRRSLAPCHSSAGAGFRA